MSCRRIGGIKNWKSRCEVVEKLQKFALGVRKVTETGPYRHRHWEKEVLPKLGQRRRKFRNGTYQCYCKWWSFQSFYSSLFPNFLPNYRLFLVMQWISLSTKIYSIKRSCPQNNMENKHFAVKFLIFSV